jgi:DNA-binding LytR/AlgR family response regulator
MINSLIIDDQKAAIALLSDYARYSDINVVDTFTNPLEAVEFVLTSQTKIDLIFLDINMDEIDGFEFIERTLKTQSNLDFKIVFITAYPEYAIRGYDFSEYVVGFLPKPIPISDFQDIVDRYQKVFLRQKNLIIHQRKQIFIIPFREILYIEGARNQIYLYQRKNNDSIEYKFYMTFNDMLSRLPSSFIRIHKSYIVQKENIDQVEPNRVKLKFPKVRIPIGQTYKKEAINRLTLTS